LNRDFFLYTFAYDQSLATILTQKDDDKNEAPMSFMRTNLQGVELNYLSIDKQAYAVYKEVKHFKSYILKNHTKVIVPHPAVQSLFTQQDMGEIRGNWMEVVQEFDPDIKPSKLIKGQGLWKLAVEDEDQANKDSRWENEMELWCEEASYISPGPESSYKNLNYLLHYGAYPENLNPRERRALRLKSAQYRLINSILFRINYDGVLLICPEHEDIEKVLNELHDGPIRGHFMRNTIAHKILRADYYYPTLFKDAHTYAKNYKTCQMSVGKEKREAIPLQHVTFYWPLTKFWEILGQV
jgi:hypothetical protein